MKALVVFESLFGNTAAVGEAVATSLRAHGVDAEAVPVDHLDPATVAEVDLLIVGGPTHAHGMSRQATRRAGVKDETNTYPEPTIDPGLREWFDRVPPGNGRPAAAFDTRFDKAEWLTGSAAKGIAKRLGRDGFRLVAHPESFFVTTENALEEGELEHAERWAVRLTELTSTKTG
jgi:hypothetical protein